jgi:hypothetical protein
MSYIVRFSDASADEVFEAADAVMRRIRDRYPQALFQERPTTHLYTKEQVILFWSSREVYQKTKQAAEEERLKLTSKLYQCPPLGDEFSEEMRAKGNDVFRGMMKTFGTISSWREKQLELESAAGMIVLR